MFAGELLLLAFIFEGPNVQNQHPNGLRLSQKHIHWQHVLTKVMPTVALTKEYLARETSLQRAEKPLWAGCSTKVVPTVALLKEHLPRLPLSNRLKSCIIDVQGFPLL